MSKKTVLGMDIGYSNLKIAYGNNDDNCVVKVLPIGAGPSDLLPIKILGEKTDDKSVYVYIDDQKWVVGVEPNRLQGWDRELHKDYPSTKSYKALYYASLLLSEQSQIDLLVTGLPVDQSLDLEYKNKLIESLKGTHQITPKVSVTVKDVMVIPQPVGAYLDVIKSYSNNDDLLDVINNGKTVVIDPGYFSVDWVVIDCGEVRYKSSGTSLKAMSVLIEEVNELIKADYGSSPGKNKIEEAVRSGENQLYIHGSKVNITNYIELASKKVSEEALVAMRTSIRDLESNVDTVIITGGGANSYRKAVENIFPNSRIVISDNPVAANATGFYYCATLK